MSDDFATLTEFLPGNVRLALRADAIWYARPDAGDTVAQRWTVFCGLPPSDVAVVECSNADLTWLRSLDGLAPWSRSAIQARESNAHRAEALVRALLATGGLDDASSMPSSWRLNATRTPGNRAALLTSGCTPWQANDLIDRRADSLVAIVGSGWLADLAITRGIAAGLDCRSFPAEVEERPAGVRIALIVGPGHPLVVDRVDTAWHAIDHLPVRCWGTTARVGPLVSPGTTGCLRCAHLHAADAFPAWADRSWQAVHIMRETDRQGSRSVDTVTADLAIALAVRLTRTVCVAGDDRRTPPGIAYDIAYDIVSEEPLPRAVQQPVHPLCGCQWDRLSQDT